MLVQQKYEKLLFKEDGNDYLLICYKGKAYSAGLEKYTVLDIKKYLNNIIFNNKNKIDKMIIIFRGNILDNNLDIKKEGLTSRKLELIVID